MRRWPPHAWAAICAVLVYLPTLSGGYCRDDEVQLAASSPIVRGELGTLCTSHYWAGSDPTGNLYRPLTTVSIALESLLAGEAGGAPRPAVHHAVNLLLHAGGSALAVALLAAFGLSGPGLWIAGLWLAMHPVRADAVCEVVQRAEVLSLAGICGALLALFRWRASGSPRWLAAVGACALGGLLAKESAMAIVLLLPLVHWLGVAPATDRRWWPAYAVLGGTVALYAMVRLAVLGTGPSMELTVLDNPAAHASNARLWASAAGAATTYARLTVLPWGLSPDYSYAEATVPESWFELRVLFGCALGLAALVGLVRGRLSVPVALGCGWLAATLGPFANVVFPMGYLVAERALYAPLFGVALLLGVAWRRWAPDTRAWWIGGMVVCALFGVRTLWRSWEWRAQRPLYQAAADHGSRSARVWFVLGIEAARIGDDTRAAAALARATELWPDYAQAWSAAAEIATLRRDPTEARRCHERAVATAAPWDFRPHLNYGVWLGQQGDVAGAVAAYREAIRRAPTAPDGYINLAITQQHHGDTAGARRTLLDATAAGVQHPTLQGLAAQLR